MEEKLRADIVDVLCHSHGHFRDRPYSMSRFKLPSNLIVTCLNKWFDEYDYNEKAAQDEYAKSLEQATNLERLIKGHFVGASLSKPTSMKKWLDEILLMASLNKENCFVKKAKLEEIIQHNEPVGSMRATGISSVAQLLNKFSVLDIICLTRIFEDESWHDKQYNLYGLLKKDDLESRNITIRVFEPTLFRTLPRRLYDKGSIWADKIGGTIFAVPYLEEEEGVCFLRASTRLFHYAYELLMHCEYINSLSNHSFSMDLMRYMRDDCENVDFFEPHFLFEAFVWQFAMEKYFEVFEYIKPNLPARERQGVLYVNRDNMRIISYDINDIISNAHKRRKPVGKHRMLSMRVKKALLNEIYTDKQLMQMLMNTLGYGSLFR